MRYVVEAYRALVFGLWAALLPSPERDRFARQHELDAPRWSFQLGLLQGSVGVGLFLMGGLAFMRPATTDQSILLLQNWWPGLSTTHFQGLGMINWFAWFLYPVSWPFAYLALVGLIRCIAFAATREAVGEPIVWASLRTIQETRARSAARRRAARLGPIRPDKLLRVGGTRLVVLTCREKPDWTPAATIALGDRYYRVAGMEERPDGAWHALAYLLLEQGQGAIIRRLVSYTPPDF